MFRKFSRVFLLLTLAVPALPAAAQTELQVQPAELAAGFGATEGTVVTVADQLVFVNASDPNGSFAVARSNIESLDRAQDVVTLVLRNPVRNQRQVVLRLNRPPSVLAWFEAAPSSGNTVATASSRDGNSTTFQARHDHLIGQCMGQLIVMEDRLAFESLDERNDSRQWDLADISELDQDGIYKLRIRPFLGNEYNLELVGRGMNSREFGDLVSRVADARARR